MHIIFHTLSHHYLHSVGISLLINQSHGLLIMYLSWACQLSHCLSLIQKKKLLHKTSFKLNILYKEKKSLCLECSEDFKEKDHI